MAFTIAFGGILYGYTLSGLNSSYRVIEKVNGWPRDDFRESVAVAMTPAGGLIGCLTGGAIVAIGRRNLMLLVGGLISFGVILALPGSYVSFVIGRFVQGLSVGYYSFLTPLYLREISPAELGGILGAMFVLFQRAGTLVTFLVCMLLPSLSKAKTTDQWWRIEIGFPLLLVAVQSLSLLLYYVHDTPKGSMLKGDEPECRRMLKQMFKSDERIEHEIGNIRSVLMDTSGKEVTFRELFSPAFRRALLVGAVLKLVQVLSGYSAVMLYSTSIFQDPNDENASLRATVFVGIANTSAVVIFSLIADKLGRRRILLAGTTVVLIVNLVIGYSLRTHQGDVARIAVVVFILCYSTSLGPVPWILVGEILPAKGVSFTVAFDWTSVTFLSLAYKPISAAIGQHNTFFVFAAVNLFTIIFSWFLLKETKGNTEMENRLLYSPKEVREKRMALMSAQMQRPVPEPEVLKINKSFSGRPEDTSAFK